MGLWDGSWMGPPPSLGRSARVREETTEGLQGFLRGLGKAHVPAKVLAL